VSENANLNVARFVHALDAFVFRTYGAQLQVEVDDVGYVIYAAKGSKRMCFGCGRSLTDEMKKMDVWNQGTLRYPVLFLVQCAHCNEALVR
jgi:hypothetical protein